MCISGYLMMSAIPPKQGYMQKGKNEMFKKLHDYQDRNYF